MQIINESILEFENYLASENHLPQSPSSLYEPINYIIGLGGKRVRPALLMASCAYSGGQIRDGLNAGFAVEIFHNFTLLHDDIMDNADTRRGQATVHKKYDVNSAILSGDSMAFIAYQYLLKYNPEISIELISVFSKMAIELCEGQRLDMDFEQSEQVTISDYLHMITNKTSVLLAACMQMGAIIAGADKAHQKHVYEFGKNIGIAFQIQDDILDTFGDASLIGKKSGGDISQNKKTYLYLKALELSTDQQKEELLLLYNSNADNIDEEEKIAKVRKIFNTLVVEEYANQLKEAYMDLAISHVRQLDIAQTYKDELIAFSEYLVKRSN
ncbi:MAG: polyprenyl synthetase family protein [Saprospiraceae bacterium]|nr:polyprenyl synthetase family protein [Saprospiraceae bacterium]